MNNLEKIKLAWAMGWSAVIKDIALGTNNEYLITSIPKGYSEVNFIWTKDLFGYGHCIQQNIDDLNELHEITGYLYAGELAGNEPIPLGQKFKIKGSDIIGEHITDSASSVTLRYKRDVGIMRDCCYPKLEIEPYFE